jgi:hypothetical protein
MPKPVIQSVAASTIAAAIHCSLHAPKCAAAALLSYQPFHNTAYAYLSFSPAAAALYHTLLSASPGVQLPLR